MANNDYLHNRIPLISSLAPEASASVSDALKSKNLNSSDKLIMVVLFLELLQTDLDYVEMSYKDIRIRVSTVSKSSYRRSMAKLKLEGFLFTVSAPGKRSRIYLANPEIPQSKLYPLVGPVGTQTSVAGDTGRQKPVPLVTPVGIDLGKKETDDRGGPVKGTTQNVVSEVVAEPQHIVEFGVSEDSEQFGTGLANKLLINKEAISSNSKVLKKIAEVTGAKAPDKKNLELATKESGFDSFLRDALSQEQGKMESKEIILMKRDRSNAGKRGHDNGPRKIEFNASPEMIARLMAIEEKNKPKVVSKKKPTKPTYPKGASLFDDPSLSARKSVNSKSRLIVRDPETVNELWQCFKHEMRLRWDDADFQLELSGKDLGQLKRNVMCYKPKQIVEMIRILVWDWDTIKTSCFPFMPNRPRPTVENLWRHSNDLFSAVGIGISDSREGRLSQYRSRYINKPVAAKSNKKSMLDRFKSFKKED